MKSPAVKLIGLLTLLFCWPILLHPGIVGNFGDIYQYAAPFRSFAQTALQAGHIPLWNSRIFCGAPFLASPQSALFYPWTPLFAALPLARAFNLFTVFHLFLNALGFYLLLRGLRKSNGAALLGAMVWGFSFFFLSKLAAGHVIHLSGYAWTPFCLLFMLRWLSSDRPDAFGLDFCALICASALQFFSGHIQVWLYTSLFLAILFFRELSKVRPEKRKAFMKGGLLLAGSIAALSLVQSFPTLIYILQSTRHRALDLFGEKTAYDFATSYSMPWKNLLGWILPGFFGYPMKGTFIDQEHPSVYFETHGIYLGLLPLALALGGLAWAVRNKRFFLPVTAAVFLLLSTGRYSGIYPWIWKLVGFQRVPARFYLIVLIALSFAAVFAWDRWVKGRKTGLKAALLLIVALDLFLNGRRFIWTENAEARLGRSQTLSWIQTALDRSAPFDPVDGSPYRVFTTAEIGNPNKTTFFGIKNANGYEAILQRSLLSYFALTQNGAHLSSTGVDVIRPNLPSFSMTGVKYLVSAVPFDMGWPLRLETPSVRVYENPRPIFPIRAVFSARTLPDLPTILDAQDSEEYRGEILKEDPQLLRGIPRTEEEKKQLGTREELPVKETALIGYFRTDSGRIVLNWKRPEAASFWIFLSEASYPGWQVWTEKGRKLDPFPANGYFQACLYTAGDSTHEKVYWLFRPTDFIFGAWITLSSAAALAAFGLFALRRKDPENV
jgi:hypothetical protein